MDGLCEPASGVQGPPWILCQEREAAEGRLTLILGTPAMNLDRYGGSPFFEPSEAPKLWSDFCRLLPAAARIRGSSQRRHHVQVLKGHTKRVNTLAFSPDSRLLVSGATDYTVRLWDTLTGDGRVLVPVHQELFADPEHVAFTADGQCVLIRSIQNGVQAWAVKDGLLVATLIAGSSVAYHGGLAVSHRAGLVAASEWSLDPSTKVVRIWDTTTWEETVLYRPTDNYSFSGLAFDPTGTRLATRVGVFDVRTGQRLTTATFGGDTLKWSPSASLIVGSGYGNQLEVYEADAGKRVKTIALNRKHVQDFAFSVSGDQLAVVSNEETVRVWNTRTWEEGPTLAWKIGKLKSIAFSPDGTRAACGSERGRILVWDLS